jgi:two-component system, NtrC family, sensor kinase
MTQAIPTSATQLRAVPQVIRERRWWLLPLTLWGIVVALSLQLQIDKIREQSTRVAIEGARNMFRMVMLTRNWNASHGGVYVPVTPATQPNPYLEHPRRDVTTTDGVAMTMINPAYMTRLIADMAVSDGGVVFRLTSLRPIRPANMADDWERRALEAFERGEKEVTGTGQSPHGTILRYMAPLLVQESCLTCHAKQGYKTGDIRGGLSVSQSYAPVQAATRDGIRQTTLAHGTAFLLVLAVSWGLLEVLRRRWFELAGKMGELEEAHGQLLQSEKMASIGVLAAGVAHEINNPVGFVNSNLGTLKNYTEELIALLESCRASTATEADFIAADFDYLKADSADLIRESRDGLERVRKIVANLKDFSRLDQAEWQEADLNAGIECTLNVVWNELKYRAEVVREYDPGLPRVPCLPAQINQVVMNLLTNAAHAIEERGTITVRSGHDARWAWIEVADSGHGMPPEVLKRIFDPFYTTKPVGEGTGLGLSISYDIISKHGGHIDVSSEPGHGTTFRVCLPLLGRNPVDKATP